MSQSSIMAVGVKPLEWREIHQRRSDEDPNTEVVGFEADTGFGTCYTIETLAASFTVDFDFSMIGEFETEREAKGAAQTHFANLILSALTTSPASSAVEGEAAYWVAETRMGLVPADSYQPHAIPLYRHPAPTPVVIHFEEAGHYQLMTADVPTFTGQPMTVQPLRDMQTREIMGFQWDDAPTPAGEWRPIDTADKEAGRMLLGIVRNGNLEEVHIGFYSFAYNEDEVGCWWSEQGNDEIVPTHWAPLFLPASPAPHQEGRADG